MNFVVSKASCKISELKHLKSHYSSKTVIYKLNYPKKQQLNPVMFG